MSKTVILVCAHKQDACLKTPPYQPCLLYTSDAADE